MTTEDLVISHERQLGGIQSALEGLLIEVRYIKCKVDEQQSAIANGKAEVAKLKSEEALSASEQKGEDWLNRIIKSGVSKSLGYVVVFIVLSAFANSGVTLLSKHFLTKEPEQQKEIIEKLDIVKDTVATIPPKQLTAEDIQDIMRKEFERQAKEGSFKGNTGKTGATGPTGKQGPGLFGK
jgi:hypothetical protein